MTEQEKIDLRRWLGFERAELNKFQASIESCQHAARDTLKRIQRIRRELQE